MNRLYPDKKEGCIHVTLSSLSRGGRIRFSSLRQHTRWSHLKRELPAIYSLVSFFKPNKSSMVSNLFPAICKLRSSGKETRPLIDLTLAKFKLTACTDVLTPYNDGSVSEKLLPFALISLSVGKRASPTHGGRWLAQTNCDALMTHHTTENKHCERFWSRNNYITSYTQIVARFRESMVAILNNIWPMRVNEIVYKETHFVRNTFYFVIIIWSADVTALGHLWRG